MNKQISAVVNARNFFRRDYVYLKVEDKDLLEDWELVLCDKSALESVALLPRLRRCFNRVDLFMTGKSCVGRHHCLLKAVHPADAKSLAGAHPVGRGVFFCWRLLGLIPGGAPFSQLSRGVKDAMVVSTKLAKCHFDKNMQIKKKANRNNTQKRVKQESIHRECQDCKRGLR